MDKKNQVLTTSEFASKIGISSSSVSKLIREGKIKAEKKSGKWIISPDQLQSQAVKNAAKKSSPKKTAGPAPKKAAAQKPATANKSASPKSPITKGKMYTVAEFASMTYLTELGVKDWLKQGRLTGQQVAGGEWMIDAANLEATGVKRLVRGS